MSTCNKISYFLHVEGSRDGAVVRTFTNVGSVQFPDLHQIWVELVVGSCPCSERFFFGYSGFPLSSKTNISNFQFNLQSEGHGFVSHNRLLSVLLLLNIVYLFMSTEEVETRSSFMKAINFNIIQYTMQYYTMYFSCS